MKTNKSYKEAILRAYQTEKENEQPQENLLHLKQQVKNDVSEDRPGEDLIIETHKNLMRSWMNLRGLDQKLATSGKTK